MTFRNSSHDRLTAATRLLSDLVVRDIEISVVDGELCRADLRGEMSSEFYPEITRYKPGNAIPLAHGALDTIECGDDD